MRFETLLLEEVQRECCSGSVDEDVGTAEGKDGAAIANLAAAHGTAMPAVVTRHVTRRSVVSIMAASMEGWCDVKETFEVK